MFKVNEEFIRTACIESYGDAVGELVFKLELEKAQSKVDRLNELRSRRIEISQRLTRLDDIHANRLAPLLTKRDQARNTLQAAEQAVADQVIANDQERNAELAKDGQAQLAMRAISELPQNPGWKVADWHKPTRIEPTLEDIQAHAQYKKDTAHGYKL